MCEIFRLTDELDAAVKRGDNEWTRANIAEAALKVHAGKYGDDRVRKWEQIASDAMTWKPRAERADMELVALRKVRDIASELVRASEEASPDYRPYLAWTLWKGLVRAIIEAGTPPTPSTPPAKRPE